MLIWYWVTNKNSLIVALSILCQFFISNPLWKLALLSWHFQGFRKEKLTWNGSIIKTNNECFLESYRSSRSQMFFKIGIPKNFAIFTVKHLCRSPILIKVCNDFKKRLQHKCFPVNIAKILRTSLFTEYIWWLLLNLSSIVIYQVNENIHCILTHRSLQIHRLVFTAQFDHINYSQLTHHPCLLFNCIE